MEFISEGVERTYKNICQLKGENCAKKKKKKKCKIAKCEKKISVGMNERSNVEKNNKMPFSFFFFSFSHLFHSFGEN